MDPLTQTIAELLYLRTMLRLPPAPIKDKEGMAVAEFPDPVPAEMKEESRRRGLVRPSYYADATRSARRYWAAMAAGRRFSRPQLRAPRGWT
jgi:hypothetical protein